MHSTSSPLQKSTRPDALAMMNARAWVFKDIGLPAIHKMSQAELVRLQEQLGLGSVWGILLFPEAWLPPGQNRQLSARCIDIAGGVESATVSKVEQEIAIRTVTAGVLLCIAAPIYNPRYTQYLQPSSVLNVGRNLIKMAAKALQLPPRADGKFFARLPRPGDSKVRDRERIEIERFQRFAERGLWDDFPEKQLLSSVPSPVGKTDEPKVSPKEKPFMPLSDNFLAEAGHRVVWLVETLGPALLCCGKAIYQIRRDFPLNTGVRETQRWRRTELSKDFLQTFEWRAPDGALISEIPFTMDFRGLGKGGEFVWPPRTMSQIRMLTRILQSAHLFMFLISTGGRISEALSLQPGCIVENPDGIPLANGRTYKLTSSFEGKERDWPLPAIAVQALMQQEELAAFTIANGNESDDDENSEELFQTSAKPEDSTFGDDAASEANAVVGGAQTLSVDSIWTREGGSGQAIYGDYNVYLRRLVKVLGLTEKLGGGNLHAHRFRKSTARLIALSILGAPKILMDLFGHKQIGMTLHYILADPTIRAEMLEVAQAQTIMLAKTAIIEIDETGGPAASNIKAAVEAVRFRMGDDFGEDTVEELAETLTINGRHWQLVRPGVVCTKGPQVAGACTPSTAMPEPSRCRPSCDHRLELGFLRSDVDNTIRFAVTQVERAIVDGDEMKAEMWRGQILTNIERFESLKTQWGNNAIVAELLKTRARVVAV